LPDEKLTFDPKNIKAKARDGAAPPPALPAAPRAAVDLEAKPVEETNAAGAAPDAGKNIGAEASDNIVNAEEPTQTTLDFITN
jgi:hypothetical protein